MSYRGQRIPIVCGAGGYNGNDNQARIPETDLVIAENLCFEGDAWRKLSGATCSDAARLTTGAAVTTSSANTTYTPTTVTDASAWTLSSVTTEMVAVAGTNQGKISAVDDATDTLTVERWVPSTPADTTVCNVYAMPRLVAGHDWHPTVGTQRLVTAWSHGYIYKGSISNVDDVTLRSGLTIANPGVFVEGGQEAGGSNRKLFFFNRGMVPQVLAADGATCADITSPSADWTSTNQPSAGLRFAGRMLAYRNPYYPHAVYGSSLSNHEDFAGTDAIVTDCWAGEGEYVACVIPFISSSGGTRLYVFKYPFGLYWLDISDPINPIAYKVRDDIGMAGPLAWCRIGNDVIFLSSQGSLHSLRAVETAEDIASSDLASVLNLRRWLKTNLYYPRLEWATAVYDELRKEARIAFTGNNDYFSTTFTNGTAIIADLQYASKPRIAFESRGRILDALFKRKTAAAGDTEICGGGVGGLVYRFGDESRNVNGNAYTGRFKTIDTDLSFHDPEFAKVEKRFDYLEATITETGNYDITLNVYIDGVFSQAVTMDMGQSGSLFGTGVFGTAVFGGSTTTVGRKVEIAGHGMTIAVEGVENGLNEDFSLSEIAVWCQPSGISGTKVGG